MKNFTKAIELYVLALGAGDPAAPQSLQFTISLLLDENSSELESLASHKNGQWLVTLHLISRFGSWRFHNSVADSTEESESGGENTAPLAPGERWLEALEKAGVKDLELAEQVALAYYQLGKMEEAQRWVNRSRSESVIAQWIQAKLWLREGEVDSAAKILAKLVKYFPVSQKDAGLKKELALIPHLEMDNFGIAHALESTLALAIQSELGVLQLTRGDFLESCDTLVRNGTEADALYLMERVLLLDELKNYVDLNFPESAETLLKKGKQESSSAREKRTWVRGILGRRLNRNLRFSEASVYLSGEPKAQLSLFVGHRNVGWDILSEPDVVETPPKA